MRVGRGVDRPSMRRERRSTESSLVCNCCDVPDGRREQGSTDGAVLEIPKQGGLDPVRQRGEFHPIVDGITIHQGVNLYAREPGSFEGAAYAPGRKKLKMFDIEDR